MPDFALTVPFPGLAAIGVAQDELDETAGRPVPLLPLRSRVETVVLYEHVEADHWREVHIFELSGV